MNKWSDAEAQNYITKYAPAWGEDLALRVYTSRLIGQDPSLVLHGGGNTSVKIKVTNKVKEQVEVIAVKGSGWDLSNIEPQGFPCVDLEHCRKLRQLDSLSDEDMVNELRSHITDANSPNPSVETLLHAFLPHKFIDHSHADAVLALVDQPSEELARKVFGDKFGIVPYIMPGFKLAKKAYEVYLENPNIHGLILLRHGIFTFAETAKESYDLHIEAVQNAVNYINKQALTSLTPVTPPFVPAYHDIAPLLRGLFYKQSNKRWVFHLDASEVSKAFSNSHQVAHWSQCGPCTPDHVIRTKRLPMLLLDWPENGVKEYLEKELDTYIEHYHHYFKCYNDKSQDKKKELDPLPRVLILRGIGIVYAARQMGANKIAKVGISSTSDAANTFQDIYQHSIDIFQQAETVGKYEPASEEDIWDMEYWSLEQAKLGKSTEKVLEGRVTYVTGAGSGIGRAIAIEFAKSGSNLFLTDINADNLKEVTSTIASLKLGVAVVTRVIEVTSEEQVNQSFIDCTTEFGGLDIAISNAGAPYQGLIGDSTALLRQSFELNFFAHQFVSAGAVHVFMKQNQITCPGAPLMGGCLLFNTSKASVNPGPNFGPYAIAKAATLALMKQYALEYGVHQIRSNAVNADRVRTSFFSSEVVEKRAQSRGLTPEQYFANNLLKHEVTAEDVARAFLALALSPATSAATLTVDGGNIEASMR